MSRLRGRRGLGQCSEADFTRSPCIGHRGRDRGGRARVLWLRFAYDVDGFPPVAVSPTEMLGVVFVGEILGIVDEDVGALGEFADAAVKEGMPGSLSVA